jgi:hypothetical protein
MILTKIQNRFSDQDLFRLCSNTDLQRDSIFTKGPADVLDHATSEIAIGTKLKIDARRELPGEGFKRPWPPLIRMCDEVRRKTSPLFGSGRWSELSALNHEPSILWWQQTRHRRNEETLRRRIQTPLAAAHQDGCGGEGQGGKNFNSFGDGALAEGRLRAAWAAHGRLAIRQAVGVR